MTDLIARLEAAGVDEQRDILGVALAQARNNGWISARAAADGFVMIQYGAYESAAMLLVPDGWRIERLEQGANGTFGAYLIERQGPRNSYVEGFSTLALAIAAAAVKAKESEDGYKAQESDHG